MSNWNKDPLDEVGPGPWWLVCVLPASIVVTVLIIGAICYFTGLYRFL